MPVGADGMQVPIDASPSPVLDVEVLESDPAPTFIIRVSTTALKFDALYANEAYRTGGFQDVVLADNREALLFRSWAQALGRGNTSQPVFAGWTWSAELSPRNGTLKLIRAMKPVPEERLSRKYQDSRVTYDLPQLSTRRQTQPWSTDDFATSLDHERPALLLNLPHTNMDARWKVMQAMMEMSDVGVFEYNPEGKLLHGNEAWYRLR
jgi:hypothetical protein